jgi:hypothetical protein
MFMMFMWLACCIAGGVMQGQLAFSSTRLSASLTDSGTTINVDSTAGFPNTGIIVIENEHIAYSNKTATSFTGTLVNPLIRGAENTEAAAHADDVMVSTVPGAMMNSSAAYNIAVLSDASGMMAFVSVPLAFFKLLGSFFFLPLQFLGTDLQILTYVWAVIGVGMLAAITIQLAGGRRV